MAATNGIEIDISLWPIVRCTPRGHVTDADYEAMFERFEQLWRRGERFMTITDARFNDKGTPKQRQRIGEWMKEHASTIKSSSLGSIVIVESALVRGALTAIGWVSQADMSSSYVKDWAHASALAIDILQKEGLLTEKTRVQLLRAG